MVCALKLRPPIETTDLCDVGVWRQVLSVRCKLVLCGWLSVGKGLSERMIVHVLALGLLVQQLPLVLMPSASWVSH